MNDSNNEKVKISSYFVLIFALIFFSGIFANADNFLSMLDFSTLNGEFGQIITESGSTNFMGEEGSGARDGFLFAFSLVPAIMLALGIVNIVDYYGGLDAAKKMLTPILRPILGIPGSAGLALITSLQNTDAGATMTKMLYDDGEITDSEKSIFAAFQFSAGATILNYFAISPALFALTDANNNQAVLFPIIVPFIIILIMKFVGTNVMRLYLRFSSNSNG